MIFDSSPGDSGTYTCEADNGYTSGSLIFRDLLFGSQVLIAFEIQCVIIGSTFIYRTRFYSDHG